MKPRCPRGLKKNEAKQLWKDVWADFDLDPVGRELLRTAVFCLDGYLQARDLLGEEGYTFKTGTQIRKHPANEILKDMRSGFLNAMKELNLTWEEEEKPKNVGRPFTLVK